MEYVGLKQVVASAEIKQQILKAGIRKLEREARVSHHTIDRILKGENVRRRTLAKMAKTTSRKRRTTARFLKVFGVADELLSQTTDQFEFRSTRRNKRSNVTHRRLAEEAAVFAIELCRTFIADLEGCTGSIETSVQHQAPR